MKNQRSKYKTIKQNSENGTDGKEKPTTTALDKNSRIRARGKKLKTSC